MFSSVSLAGPFIRLLAAMGFISSALLALLITLSA